MPNPPWGSSSQSDSMSESMEIVGSPLEYKGAVRPIYAPTGNAAKIAATFNGLIRPGYAPTGEGVEVAAIFNGLATAEAKLGKETQERLEKMGRGPAAELLGRVMDKGEKIRNPDKYIVTAANRADREQNMREAIDKQLPMNK